MTQLSPHFWLKELTRSDTAERMRIDNTPPPDVVANLKAWCLAIGEPIRVYFDKPVSPSSGYRSPAVNKLVSGNPEGQHPKGEAVDFEIFGVDNKVLAQTIIDLKLPFDQLILEFYTPGDPNSGWVHVSHKAAGKNRGQVLRGMHDPKNPKKTIYPSGLG